MTGTMLRPIHASALAPAALCLLLAAIAGCGKRPEPEGELGTFHVEARAADNECGEGALGLESAWGFDVELARAGDQLQWDNGYDVVFGDLGEDDRTFTFDSSFAVDMRTEEDPGWLPACSVRRTDVAEGKLSSATDDVESFRGRLSYLFEPTEGSDCSDLAGSTGPVFLRLPCSVQYDVTAERTRAPGEDGALNEE